MGTGIDLHRSVNRVQETCFNYCSRYSAEPWAHPHSTLLLTRQYEAAVREDLWRRFSGMKRTRRIIRSMIVNKLLPRLAHVVYCQKHIAWLIIQHCNRKALISRRLARNLCHQEAWVCCENSTDCHNRLVLRRVIGFYTSLDGSENGVGVLVCAVGNIQSQQR